MSLDCNHHAFNQEVIRLLVKIVRIKEYYADLQSFIRYTHTCEVDPFLQNSEVSMESESRTNNKCFTSSSFQTIVQYITGYYQRGASL